MVPACWDCTNNVLDFAQMRIDITKPIEVAWSRAIVHVEEKVPTSIAFSVNEADNLQRATNIESSFRWG